MRTKNINLKKKIDLLLSPNEVNKIKEQKIKKSIDEFWALNKKKLLKYSLSDNDVNINTKSNKNKIMKTDISYNDNLKEKIKNEKLKEYELYTKKKNYSENLKNLNLDINKYLPPLPLFNVQEKEILSKILPSKEIKKYEKRYEYAEIEKDNNLHKFPVYCLAVVGNDKNIISLSTDGVLCEWSLSNLSKPLNKYNISMIRNDTQQQQDSLNEIGPLCIGTCQNKNLNEFIIGCDRNDIYNIRLQDKDYDILNSFSSNKAPIFCVCPHPTTGDNSPDFSDLFLSCGADWTTKLWSTNLSDIPLLSFNQSKDYVYSAKWHPINPYIFATGDGSGYIDLWDLNRDMEIPTFRYDLKNAINKLAWSYDGKKLAAGDINGHIAIFSSEKDVINVKNEDVNKFHNKIETIKENCIKKLNKNLENN